MNICQKHQQNNLVKSTLNLVLEDKEAFGVCSDEEVQNKVVELVKSELYQQYKEPLSDQEIIEVIIKARS